MSFNNFDSKLPRRIGVIEFCLLTYLLLAPLQVSGPNLYGSNFLDIGPPLIYSGDEPHYLIQINSLLNDGDLDLANNYANVSAGGLDAGQNFARTVLNHHVNWYIGGQLFYWSDVYETDRNRWAQDQHGVLIPRLREDAEVDPSGFPEYSIHPPGLAFLLATLLYPFRGTIWVESIALIYSGLAVVLSLFYFRSLVTPFRNREHDFLLLAAVTFLGTPIWHYARTLYTEPYLLLCSLGAYSLYLRRHKCFLAGLFLGIGILLKLQFVILSAPIAIDLAQRRKWSSLLRLGIPIVMALVILAGINHYMYGSWMRLSQQFEWENPIVGAWGQLVSSEHGLLPYAPAACVSVVSWPGFFRKRPRESVILLSAFSLQFAMIICYKFWDGGYCYGPRYLVPVLPLLFAATVVPPKANSLKGNIIRRTVFVLFFLSILINVLGAILAGHVLSTHPFRFIFRFF